MLTSDAWDCDVTLGGDSMRYAIIVLALLGVLASPRPASAQTGNELLKICPANDKSSCRMYINGWIDGIIVPKSLTKLICIPDGVTNGQMTDVFVKYLRAHPEKRHKIASILAWEATQKAFPCR